MCTCTIDGPTCPVLPRVPQAWLPPTSPHWFYTSAPTWPSLLSPPPTHSVALASPRRCPRPWPQAYELSQRLGLQPYCVQHDIRYVEVDPAEVEEDDEDAADIGDEEEDGAAD